MRLAAFAAGQILLLALIALILLVIFQRRLIYPIGFGAQVPTAPEGYTGRRVRAPSGDLLVWTAPGRPGRPAVVFLHGNATTAEGVAWVMRPFREAGWTVVSPEYPGYPGNRGTPNEQGLLDAARAGWKVASEGRAPGDVLIFGNSIGTGPATALAAETRARGLAIVSGVASMPQVIRHRIRIIPDFLVMDRFYNELTMRHVSVPVMVVHGTSDDLVPFGQGEALAAAAHVQVMATSGGHEIIGRRDVVEAVLSRFDHP
jgi:hypothetical protein